MKQDIFVKKVENIDECKMCNNLLTELISYETSFDNTIIPNMHIEDYYERTLNRDDSVLFLALSRDKAIGYVMAYNQSMKRSNERVTTIMHLYVKAEFRGKGIGRQLIDQVEKWANKENTTLIELDCFIDNKSAIEFYSKLDYKPIRLKLRKRI